MREPSVLGKWMLPLGVLILVVGIGWMYMPDLPIFEKKRTSKSAYKPQKEEKPTTERAVTEYILGATNSTFHENPCLAVLKQFKYEYGGQERNDYGITYINPLTGENIGRIGIELPFDITQSSFFQAKGCFIFFQSERLSQAGSFLKVEAATGKFCRGSDCAGLENIGNPNEVSVSGLVGKLSLNGNNGREWAIENEDTHFSERKQEMPKGKKEWKEKEWEGPKTKSRLVETTYESETNGFVTVTSATNVQALTEKYYQFPYILKENPDFLYFAYKDDQKKEPRIMLSLFSKQKSAVEWELWLLDIPEWQKDAGHNNEFNEFTYPALYSTLHLVDFEEVVVIFTKNFWISGTNKKTGEMLWSKNLHTIEMVQ